MKVSAKLTFANSTLTPSKKSLGVKSAKKIRNRKPKTNKQLADSFHLTERAYNVPDSEMISQGIFSDNAKLEPIKQDDRKQAQQIAESLFKSTTLIQQEKIISTIEKKQAQLIESKTFSVGTIFLLGIYTLLIEYNIQKIDKQSREFKNFQFRVKQLTSLNPTIAPYIKL